MCIVNVLYCKNCDVLSPIPVLSGNEHKYRPEYNLVDDEKCTRVFDCWRQSQVKTCYAPSTKDWLMFGEGPCLLSRSDTASGKPAGCTYNNCRLVRVYRDCCETRNHDIRQYSHTCPNNKDWIAAPVQWIVRKS